MTVEFCDGWKWEKVETKFMKTIYFLCRAFHLISQNIFATQIKQLSKPIPFFLALDVFILLNCFYNAIFYTLIWVLFYLWLYCYLMDASMFPARDWFVEGTSFPLCWILLYTIKFFCLISLMALSALFLLRIDCAWKL